MSRHLQVEALLRRAQSNHDDALVALCRIALTCEPHQVPAGGLVFDGLRISRDRRAQLERTTGADARHQVDAIVDAMANE